MSDDEGFSKDLFYQINDMFLGHSAYDLMGVETFGDLEEARELVMAAYVVRGELGNPDELGEENWNALAAGEKSLNDYNLHEGEARVEYWLGELSDGLSRDNLLGEMLYQAAQGNAGLNTDKSNIDFREQMAKGLADRLGELNADNLLDEADIAQDEIGKRVAKNYSYTVDQGLEAQESGELHKWYSINDTAANMANALGSDEGSALLMGAQVSWPTDADTADHEHLDKLEKALGDRFQLDKSAGPGDGDDDLLEGADEMLPIGEGEWGDPVSDFAAEEGSTAFGFSVVDAMEADGVTNVNFLDFSEDYELIFEMPEEFANSDEIEVLEDFKGLDRGDGYAINIYEVGGEGEPRMEIISQWGQDGTAQETTIQLTLQGVTDAGQIEVDVI